MTATLANFTDYQLRLYELELRTELGRSIAAHQAEIDKRLRAVRAELRRRDLTEEE